MVSAAKYPPLGIRGYGPMYTHGAGALGRAYAGAANDQVKVIVQIETVPGVENVEAIAAVEGLDVLFIG
jgi:4-hydroxy-2-oxoheptanedioate aldolase